MAALASPAGASLPAWPRPFRDGESIPVSQTQSFKPGTQADLGMEGQGS